VAILTQVTRQERVLRALIVEMILDEARRRKRRKPTPWPNLDDMQAMRRLAAVKKRRGRLIKKQLQSFRWADDPESALRDLKLRARGGR
jgi:hypothetical protein